MKLHMKRQMVPKTWGIPRKGTKYVVRPLSGGVPVLVVLRDLMKVAQTRKEVKKAINEKAILVNGKNVIDEKKGLNLFDVLSFAGKNFRMKINDKGKFVVEEIKDKADKKVAKIVGKKTLKGKKVQLNLNDGSNFLSDVKCNVGDSVMIDFKKGVEACMELKPKAIVLVIGGKHAGAGGEIVKIDEKTKMAELNIKSKEKVNVLIKHLMVVG